MKAKQVFVAIAVCAALALGVIATAEGPDAKTAGLTRGTPIATEIVGPSSLSVQSRIDYSRAVLRISGPQGLQLSTAFGADEKVHVDLLKASWMPTRGKKGERAGAQEKKDRATPPNGRYRYEIHFFVDGAKTQYFSGQFFVENGSAVSRETVRSRQARTREDLAKPSRQRTRPGVQSDEVATKGLFYQDYFYLIPFYSPNTFISMKSYDFGYYQMETFTLLNYSGDLVIGSGSYFYGYPYPDPNYFSPQMTITRGYSGPYYTYPGVGIGTTAPQNTLDVSGPYFPGIQLSNIYSSQNFVLENWGGNFDIWDRTAGTYPLVIESGTPGGLSPLFIQSSGNVGVGTSMPTQPLHIWRDDGTAQLRVEEGSSTTALRTQFWMTNNGPVNTTHDTGGATWRQQFQDNAYALTKDGTGGNEMTIIAGSGNMTIRGSLFTGGPSCGAGCDAVLGPDFTLETIEQHADAMWAAGFLPAIGPTEPYEPLNITEKIGGVLNELEKAHVYIEQLHERLAEQEDMRKAQASVEQELRLRLAAQEDRLDRLEGMLNQHAVE